MSRVMDEPVRTAVMAAVGAALEPYSGEFIKQIVEVALKETTDYGRSTVLESAVKTAIQKAAVDAVNEMVAEKQEVIRAEVREKLTDEVLKDATSRATESLIDRLWR